MRLAVRLVGRLVPSKIIGVDLGGEPDSARARLIESALRALGFYSTGGLPGTRIYLDGGHDVVQYSSFAKQKLSTASSRERHPYVNIGARTTRAERGRQTLGRAHDERSQSLGASSPGPQAPRDVDGFKLGALGRQIEARRATEPRATVGTHSRITAPTWQPAGVKGGDWTSPVRPDPSIPGPGAYHETFDFRRQATGRGSPTNKRSTFNPKAASTYWGSTSPGRGSPIMGSSGKGSPGAGRTYPVSGREVRARTMSGRWTPRDEARGPKKLLGRASPTP